jgi:DNA mismatch repair protein MutL
MKSIIRVLDEITINQIAAGEVIENPASVVKELVENSIDAGSTEITIEIKGGGRQMIRISDNGKGMCRDDALLCLERHATSKIQSIDELHATLTMGFRGEAIPSIASISKFTILTNDEDSPESASMVIVEGGKILKAASTVREKGTTMEVKGLFYNVPVRRKFQKSPAYDDAEIEKVITLLALANPKIAFTLISNEERIIQIAPNSSKPDEQLKQRIEDLLGVTFLEYSHRLEINTSTYKIHGWIGAPHEHRQNRSGQYIFINKRAVAAPFVAYALKDAYGTLLPPRRHPTFILYFELPTHSVDVNVHPQKKEVRLRKEMEIRELLLQSAREALQTHPLTPAPDFITEPCFHSVAPAFNLEQFVLNEAPLPSDPFPDLYPPAVVSRQEVKAPTAAVFAPLQIPIPIPEQKFDKPIPKALTTLPGYIVVETSSIEWFQGRIGGLSLVDQKAAHNRVIFEKLSAAKPEALQIQELLIPHTLELGSQEAEFLKPCIEMLQLKGIGIKEFGGNSFVVDSLPTILGNVDVKELIVDLIDDLKESSENVKCADLLEQRLSRSIASAAARASISKGTKLGIEEAQGLLKELFKCKSPHISPSGQPTVARFSDEEIAKQFRK